MREVKLPITRYYGSKRKLLAVIWDEIKELNLEFDTVLDLFGGSGIFSYYSKLQGKSVIYNDIFKFNQYNAKAIIENDFNPLTLEESLELLRPKGGKNYKTTIFDNFEDIFYLSEENKVIDITVQNIQELPEEKKAAGFYMLFQSCIMKRPYNLFHRKNLNLRTNYNGGTFGNKITWERTFEELFTRFNAELTEFSFSNNRDNLSLNSSALNCTANGDLVYIDPPYFRSRDHVTYHTKYHFLEGLAHYDDIGDKIDRQKKHLEIGINNSDEFENRHGFLMDMDALIQKHSNSIIIISYRSNGIPTIPELENLMKKYKQNVKVKNLGNYTYALNRNNIDNFEYLIIGY